MSVETTGASIAHVHPPVRRGLLRALLRNPLTTGSFVVLAIFVVIAIVQPWIVPFSPNHVDLSLANAAPFTTEYVLGGDKYGRDILSRLLASATGALEAALVLGIVAFVVGAAAGLVAGYYGKLFDTLSVWVFSVIMAVPGIIILIAIYTLLGTSTAVAIRGPVILLTAGLAGTGIGIQAGLDFLGLGDASQPSWGSMMTDAFTNFYVASEQLIWPAAALGLVTGAFSLVSIGLRDVLEGTYVKPSERSRKRDIETLLGPDAVQKTVGGSSGREEDASPASAASADEPLLSIQNLHIAYSKHGEVVSVVDGVSLTVADGEIVGVVGESGSGKTQTVFAALGLLPEEAIVARGSIRFDGVEILGLPDRDLAKIRGRALAYVPQEPMANLDPTFTVGSQMVYGIRAQTGMSRKDAKELTLSMLERVGIRDSSRVFKSYPHQISGGMAQRVLIAGAVACKPRLLVADEPTTALDVTIQAEVLDLLRSLQSEIQMGVLIVTHNFGVVADLCQRVIVMRDGEIVETGAVEAVFRNPQHEYTRMLLGSVLDHATPRSDLGAEGEAANAR